VLHKTVILVCEILSMNLSLKLRIILAIDTPKFIVSNKMIDKLGLETIFLL
jgi:hypothetical protein